MQTPAPERLPLLEQALGAGHEFQNVMLLNEPEESPLVAWAREAGWNEPFLQYEMTLTVS
jgi:hypothetical protein